MTADRAFLITGAAGFYGIHAVKLLAEAGCRVVAVGTSGFPQGVEDYLGEQARDLVTFEICDISDPEAVRSLFVKHPVGVVIHAAVMTILAGDEVGRERRMTEVNAVGTLNLLEAAREHRADRFVYISSSGIYDSYGQGVAPVHEMVSVCPGSTNVYRICKLYSEMMCQNFAEHGAFPVAIARIGSPYGPWERPTRTRKGMSLIYQLVHMAVRGEEALVYGRDLVRDWTHMRDIALGSILLATCEEQALQHEVYNVTCGTVSSIENVLHILHRLVPSFEYRFVSDPAEANIMAVIPTSRGPLDISRLREDCGFAPEFTIESGLEDYVKWMRTYGDL